MGLGFKAKKLINELRTLKTNNEEKTLIMNFEKFLINEANFKEYLLQKIRELIQNDEHLRQLIKKFQLQIHHQDGEFARQQVNDFRLNFGSTTQDNNKKNYKENKMENKEWSDFEKELRRIEKRYKIIERMYFIFIALFILIRLCVYYLKGS